jgi:hypothetical protein
MVSKMMGGVVLTRRTTSWALAVSIFLLAFLGSVQTLWSVTRYIEIVKGSVNIRAGTTTRSRIVAKARRGDVFELRGEEGRWYEIHLFSTSFRYVHKSLARTTRYAPEVPAEIETRQEFFRGWIEAGNRARQEADRRYPPDRNLERNLEYYQLLNDRYKLDLMHRFKLLPPVYRRIAIEGHQKGW